MDRPAETRGPRLPQQPAECAALALLCERLPQLGDVARAYGWTQRLDQEIQAVTAAGSALEACQRLGLLESTLTPVSSQTRDGVTTVSIPGLEPVQMRGDYTCPLRRCSRRAGRDQQGHPPRCALTGQAMPFTSA